MNFSFSFDFPFGFRLGGFQNLFGLGGLRELLRRFTGDFGMNFFFVPNGSIVKSLFSLMFGLFGWFTVSVLITILVVYIMTKKK